MAQRDLVQKNYFGKGENKKMEIYSEDEFFEFIEQNPPVYNTVFITPFFTLEAIISPNPVHIVQCVSDLRPAEVSTDNMRTRYGENIERISLFLRNFDRKLMLNCVFHEDIFDDLLSDFDITFSSSEKTRIFTLNVREQLKLPQGEFTLKNVLTKQRKKVKQFQIHSALRQFVKKEQSKIRKRVAGLDYHFVSGFAVEVGDLF